MSPSFREAGDITRFASRDHFAAYNGTAPIEVSPGPRKIYRLSRRGNRRINHAVEAPRHLRPQRAV
jgi:transposase